MHSPDGFGGVYTEGLPISDWDTATVYLRLFLGIANPHGIACTRGQQGPSCSAAR